MGKKRVIVAKNNFDDAVCWSEETKTARVHVHTHRSDLESQYVFGTTFELIKSQINMCGRQTTGHRYSDDQKMLALSLYDASPVEEGVYPSGFNYIETLHA